MSASLVHCLLAALTLVCLRIASATITNGSSDVDPKPRRATLQEVQFLFGISMSDENDPVGKFSNCHYCRDARAGLNYWRSHVNTHMFEDSLGRRIFVDIEVKPDYGKVDWVRQNYEELAQNPEIFALFGPTYNGFNDIAATVAAKYDKVLITWAFSPFNYFSTPGPLLSTANVPNGMPLMSEDGDRRVSAFSRRLQGDFNWDETLGSYSHLNDAADREQSGLGEDARAAYEEMTSWSHGRKLQSSEVDQASFIMHSANPFPCATEEFMRYPLYASCEAPGPIAINEEIQYHGWASLNLPATTLSTEGETLMVIPEGISTTFFCEAMNERTRAIEDHLTIKFEDASTGVCIFALSTRPMTMRNPPECPQIKMCQPPKMGDKNESKWGDEVMCITLPNGAKAGAWMIQDPSRGWQMVHMVVRKTTVDMKVVIQSNHAQRVNITMLHSGMDDAMQCDSVDLARLSGCTICTEYKCASQMYDGVLTERFPLCFGGTQVNCTIEPNPDGVMWEHGHKNILDINVPETRWAYDAVKRVAEESDGRTRFVFLYTSEIVPPRKLGISSVSWARQCGQLANYAGSITGATYDVLGVSFPPDVYVREFVNGIRELGTRRDDVMVYCGNILRASYLTLSLKTFMVNPIILIVDRPMGVSFVQAIFAYNGIGILEALPMTYNESQPCEVFEGFHNFYEGYFKYATDQDFLSYAALQTAAAGSVMLQALRALPQDSLNTTSIMTWLKSNTIRTFWGDLAFDEKGQRIVQTGGTREIRPLPKIGGLELTRYYDASILVLDRDMAEKCAACQSNQHHHEDHHGLLKDTFVSETCSAHGVGQCGYTSLKIPKGTHWIRKQLVVYPCAAGCYYRNSQCLPCPAGKHRTDNDPDCRECAPGKFAEFKGSPLCHDCYEGGFCQTPQYGPWPKANFYKILVPGNLSEEDDLTWQMRPGPYCVNPYRVEPLSKMFACRPFGICQGVPILEKSHELNKNKWGRLVTEKAIAANFVPNDWCSGINVGVLCGQCGNGTTIAPLVGRRVCNRCPEIYVPIIGVLVTALIFAVVGKILSSQGSYAARQVSLACPLFCQMIHHVHIWGIVVETLLLDADFVAAGLMIPVDLLYRPIDAIFFDCLRINNTTVTALKDLRLAATVLVPYSALILLAIHFGYDIWQSTLKFFRGVYAACRRGKDEVEDDTDARYGAGSEEQAQEKPDAVAEAEKEAANGEEKPAAKPEPSEVHTGEQKWSTLTGPGGRFASMAQNFKRNKSLRSLFRETWVMLLLFAPVVLRIHSRVFACMGVTIKDPVSGEKFEMDILIANSDVVCGSPEHDAITGSIAMALRLIYFFGPPAGVLLINAIFVTQGWLESFPHREAGAVLFAGYKTPMVWWEAMMWLRTHLFIFVGSEPERALRVAYMLLLIVVFAVLGMKVDPWENMCRKTLPAYFAYSSTAVLCLVVAGIFSPMEELSAFNIFEIPLHVKTIIICVGVALNYAVIIYGFWQLFFFGVLTELDAIMQHSSVDLDRTSTMVHGFARKCMGLNPVARVKHDHHQFIVVSKLSEGERQMFAQSLVETMSACLDSSTKFHTWLLDNAINEAFRRAVQARAAKLRELYCKYGTRKFALMDLKFIKLFMVSLRPPDIETDVTAIKEEDVTISGPNWWKMDMGRTPEHWRTAVTIHEFHDALTSVSYDVMERHPDLHRIPDSYYADKPKEVEHKVRNQVQVWHEATPLKGFETDLEQQDILSYNYKRKRELVRKSSHTEDNEMWMQLEGDTKEFRHDCAHAVEERAMEQKLSDLEKRIAELKEQLREAGDTDVPELKDDDDGPLAIEDDDTPVKKKAEEKKPVTIQVQIVSAADLHDADADFFGGKSDPYVVCRLKGRPESEWRTSTVSDDLEPVWMQSQDMTDVTEKDELEFIIWDDDNKLGTPSPLETVDDCIGQTAISSNKFLPRGYEGELKIVGPQGADWGRLKVKISVINEERAKALEQQAFEDYLDDNPGSQASRIFGHTFGGGT